MKYCYHYLAELLDYNNQVVKRISGVNLSEEKIDGPVPYDCFSDYLSKEVGEYKGQRVVITNLSLLHEVQD
jgi:hypothetical protein